jgi:hypothetical protein
MRKAFRVTTAFTGAAACAAVFTPGAMAVAAPAQRAPQAKPAGLTDCPDNNDESLHLYWTASERHGPTCVTGVGQFWFNKVEGDPGPLYSGLCTGNKDGEYVYDNAFTNEYTNSPYGLHLWKTSKYIPVYGDGVSITNVSSDGTAQCGFSYK